MKAESFGSYGNEINYTQNAMFCYILQYEVARAKTNDDIQALEMLGYY